MPTWEEFAWAAFIYRAMGGDREYEALMQQKELLNNLRTNPAEVEPAQVQDQVIGEFLNRWSCRVPNDQRSAEAILSTLQRLQPYLRALGAFDVEAVDFEHNFVVREGQSMAQEVIARCYLGLRDKVPGFGPTATSKLLHVLQPHLFVMWDNPILDHYHRRNREVRNHGPGYCAYLRMMQEMALQLSLSFRNAVLSPPAEPSQDPATYLSTQMGCDPPKTMAKYLDEYNWVTITKGVKVPPRWHP
jgi:hypothetical protein